MCEGYFTKWDKHSQCDLIIFWYNYPSVTSRDMSYYMRWSQQQMSVWESLCNVRWALFWRNFIILWYKSPFVTRREIFLHVINRAGDFAFYYQRIPRFVRKMAWDICLLSLSMRPYSLFCRSQINTPEIISKYQRLTPNKRLAHIPFRSDRKSFNDRLIFPESFLYIIE